MLRLKDQGMQSLLHSGAGHKSVRMHVRLKRVQEVIAMQLQHGRVPSRAPLYMQIGCAMSIMHATAAL